MTEANRRAQEVIDRLLQGRQGLAVLEAGCGSASHVAIPPGSVLTGIDILPDQLAANASLDVRICGDLQTYAWPPRKFDLVICWDVLEHLPRPQLALVNLVRALKSGGVLVVALPNRRSLKGMLTRLTPYAFHLWFYRNVMGDRSADLESRQFPTYLAAATGPSQLRSLAESLGCDVAHFSLYEGPVQAELRQRRPLADATFATLGLAARALTIGQYDPNLTDIIAVFRKARDDTGN